VVLVVLEAVPELNTVLPVAMSHEKEMILKEQQEVYSGKYTQAYFMHDLHISMYCICNNAFNLLVCSVLACCGICD
jgi:hypothetical protein